ncbi:MAG: hypothetical protein WCT01_04830 [Candidatus Shapirobacteria bacterium]
MTDGKKFEAHGIRRYSPEEQAILRQQLLDTTRNAILGEVSQLPMGIYTSVELAPHVQQFADSCGIASALAIRSGIGKARHVVLPVIREEDLVRRAQERGIYDRGGLFADDSTARFFREEVGIEARFQPNEAPGYGRLCVQGIREGNLVMLLQPGHFTVLYGFDKLSENEIRWLQIDPLRSNPQRITTQDLSERLVGSVLRNTGRGVPGQALVVDVSESTLLLKQVSRFTTTRKFRPH